MLQGLGSGRLKAARQLLDWGYLLADSDHPLPRLRWVGPAWLAVYLPSYTAAYGLLNFAFLCNVGVILTAIGLWRGSALLLSSQAVAALVVSGVWMVDAGSRALTGVHLMGGTAYMWDPQYPLFTRLLSLYHVAWPVLLVAALRRTGYDRRGLALQAGFAALVIAACRFTDPALNINFAFTDPFFQRALGPPAVHVLVTLVALVAGAYWPTHLLLQRWLPAVTAPTLKLEAPEPDSSPAL